MIFAGIDWADDHHDIVVTNDSPDFAQGLKILASFRVEHSHEGARELISKLLALEPDPERILVCLELKQNLLIDALMEEGFLLFMVNPKQVAKFRGGFSVCDAKDDPLDAEVISFLLKHKRNILSRIPYAADPLTVQLRIHSGYLANLISRKTSLSNQLRSTLKQYYPAALSIFKDLDSRICLDFLEQFPTPQQLLNLSEAQFRAFFKSHGYTRPSRLDSMYRISRRPALKANAAKTTAFSLRAVSLTRQLRLILIEIKNYESLIGDIARKHHSFSLFKSLPSVSDVTIARLISFLGDDPGVFSNYRRLQQYSGTAPVTHRSGKSKHVNIRRACNKTGRNLFHDIAYSFSKRVPWARAYYLRKLREGKKQNAALRCLANVIVKIVFAIWRDKKPYDPSIFADSATANRICVLERELGLPKKQRKEQTASRNVLVAHNGAGSQLTGLSLPVPTDIIVHPSAPDTQYSFIDSR